MHVFVRSPIGRTIRLRVQSSDTLSAINAKILEQHRLVFGGVQLNDNLTLADYGIKHRSTIDLQENMQIYVIETGEEGKTITLDVDSLDTIDKVKAKLQGTEGFLKSQQCLIFGNKQLEGKRTLADYNICKESTLLLVLYPLPRGTMKIYAKTLVGRTIPLEVESSDTVNSVMMKIYMEDGTRPTEQRLIFCGKLLDGRRTLADYNIGSEDSIHVVLHQSGS